MPYADLGDDRGLYETEQAVYMPTHQVHNPLCFSDGQNVHSDNTCILSRWSEHFQKPFIANRKVQHTAIHRIPHLPLRLKLDEPTTIQETIEAMSHHQCHKTAAFVAIWPEMWKLCGPMLNAKLWNLLVCCWKQGKFPQHFRDAIITTLCKCKRYRLWLLKLSGNQPTLHLWRSRWLMLLYLSLWFIWI